MLIKGFLFLNLLFGISSLPLHAQQGELKFERTDTPFYHYVDLFNIRDSTEAFEFFRNETYTRLNENEQAIDNLSVSIKKEHRKIRNTILPALVRLEHDNAALKTRLEAYTPGRDVSWIKFKDSFIKALQKFQSELDTLTIAKR